MAFDAEGMVAEALLVLSTQHEPAEVECEGGADGKDFDSELDAAQLIAAAEVETPEQVHAQQHISTLPSQDFIDTFRRATCLHESCNIPNSSTIAYGFHKMDKTERLNFVRSMLFATTAPATTGNMIKRDSTIATRKRGRDIEGTSVQLSYATTVYCVLGRRVCVQAFAALTQLSPQVISRHARDVSQTVLPESYKTEKNKSRKGKLGVQRIAVIAFLMKIASDYGMECLRRWGSQDESPLRLLPSSYTKSSVYMSYKEEWDELKSGLLEFRRDLSCPSGPISFNLFIRYWKEDMPTLRIAITGTDFCDTCTTLKNAIAVLNPNDIRHENNNSILRQHVKEAVTEFKYYKRCQQVCNNKQGDNHLIFDFAEKVLPPKLQKQPGQLHFITGLKFDLFGVSSSNLARNYVFGLPEGHWPHEKTANTVISMLQHIITAHNRSYKKCWCNISASKVACGQLFRPEQKPFCVMVLSLESACRARR